MDDVTAETSQLYGELEQSDNPPTEALLRAAEHVEHEQQEVIPAWNEFKNDKIEAINRVLQSAHRPAINLEKSPDNMPDTGDED